MSKTQIPAAWINDPLLLQSAADGTISVSVMQLRQDRAREVALRQARKVFVNKDVSAETIDEYARHFLPFLLGEDNPTT